MPAESVYSVISQIPYGRVTTYGQIASLAGLGRGARAVGRILKNLPSDTSLPWHRVVNSQGRPSFPVGSESYKLQKLKLQQEGIVFHNDRINLNTFGWGAA